MAAITAPKTLEEISNIVLKRTTTNAGDIFDKSKINKWSKRKPIRHPEPFKLNDTQIQGDETDRNNGIYYGLKVSSNQTILSDLHNADWSYASFPTGGIGTSPFRMWDFIGYDPDAEPTLSGSGIGAEVYYDVTNMLGVFLDWNLTGNTTGVDIGEIMTYTGVGNLSYADLYMCILIDGYATAMKNTHAAVMAGTDYAPVLYNGTYCETFTCPSLKAANILQSAATRKVTILLTDYIHAQPLMGSWKYVLNDATYSGKYISIPNVAGLSVNFKASGTSSSYGQFTLGDLTQLSNTVNMGITCTVAPTEGGWYRIVVIIGNNYRTSGEFQVLANNKNFISPPMTLPDGVFSGVYDYTATLYRLTGKGGDIKQSMAFKRGSITISL